MTIKPAEIRFQGLKKSLGLGSFLANLEFTIYNLAF